MSSPSSRLNGGPSRARRRWQPLAVLVAAVLATAGGLASQPAEAAAASETLWGNQPPSATSSTETAAVTVGTKFRSSANGAVSAIRLYKGTSEALAITGALWDDSGRTLATVEFPRTRAVGWLEAPLASPATLTAGRQYVVSYRSTTGRYSYAYNALGGGKTITSGSLVALSGVYRYSSGFPSATHRNAAYFVDVRFTKSDGTPSIPPTPTNPPTSATPTPPAPPASNGSLSLPRVAWEGGSEYWRKFSNAQRWTDPSFFPIGIWYNQVDTNEQAAWDKAHGINTYAGLWEGTNFSLLERNDMYWLGGKMNSTFKDSSPNWPGVFMDDEVDGRFTAAEGRKLLQGIKDRYAGSGKFMFANYTQMVIGQDIPKSDQEAYVNLTDAVSMDQYWYTIPFCDWTPYRGTLYADPIPQKTCRTASSYGKAVNSLTIRDAADGKLQPRWMFLENFNGSSGAFHIGYLTPGQVKGAAMNSIINEARGLLWFNQSFSGSCRTSKALRDAQSQGSKFCAYPQMQAMGEVNNLVHSLARVLNTQSYQWTFGTGLDTMLKTHDGYAYIFAMTDGTTGSRTFTLPAGISGKSAEVIGENRTLNLTGTSFSDTFANEYTYHIYKIKL